MPPSPASRDRALRRVRVAAWGVGVGAAALTGGLSVVAAHAFKGHDGKARATATTAVARRARAVAHVRVPPPQRIPAIAGQPAPLQPPPQPPAATVPQEQAPAPPVSGGS
jgi:uncharacterized protein YggE